MASNMYRDDEQNLNETQAPAQRDWKAAFRWFFQLRGVALSLPVAVIAVLLAVNNAANLPGALMIGAGRNVITIGRSVLIMGPLALTALSILMTLFSKKVIYPWLISVFTLLLPLALLLTMSF